VQETAAESTGTIDTQQIVESIEKGKGKKEKEFSWFKLR
jgi:hypothetical protein